MAKRTSVSIPAATADRLKKEAVESFRSVSQLVRAILDNALPVIEEHGFHEFRRLVEDD